MPRGESSSNSNSGGRRSSDSNGNGNGGRNEKERCIGQVNKEAWRCRAENGKRNKDCTDKAKKDHAKCDNK